MHLLLVQAVGKGWGEERLDSVRDSRTHDLEICREVVIVNTRDFPCRKDVWKSSVDTYERVAFQEGARVR